MPQHRGSQWRVLRRCIEILTRLQRGPAPSDELLAIVSASEDDPSEPAGVKRRFEEDRRRLRQILGCNIEYDHRSNQYNLREVDLPLLDLPPEAIRGLAFLQATFSKDAPMSHEVGTLIDLLLMLISEERRREVAHERALLEVDLRPRDKDRIEDAVWEAIQKACNSHRQLEFDYFSPRHADREPRRNLVEPQRYYFDTTRKHYYLEAFCLEVSGPKGTWPRREVVHYRIGRIRGPRVIPQVFVPRRMGPRLYELIYELGPEIARLGVTEHFPSSQVDYRPDGSTEVHTMVDDLFFALRALLHYGPGCRVLGGEEALREMRKLIKAMADQYQQPEKRQPHLE